jgi:SAM-dependent methyltransferase
MRYRRHSFDAALFLYGQLAVFPVHEARHLLEQIAQSLKPGGKLVVELLDQNKVNKEEDSWWFSDDQGLWGNTPFLHLGERFWLEQEAMSIERFHILQLDNGELEEIVLCDQTYAVDEMKQMMIEAGFASVDVYPAWDGLPLYDAAEWIVYVAHTGQ